MKETTGVVFMDVPRLDLEHLAQLAGLALEDDERRRFTGDLERLLVFLGELPPVEVEMAAEDPSSGVRPPRPDTVISAEVSDLCLTLAPQVRDRSFVVPRVGDDEEAGGVE